MDVADPKAHLRKGGRKAGSLGKYSESQLKRLLHVLAHRDEEIITEIVNACFDRSHPACAVAMKILANRLIPETKAIEISGLGGKELALKVIVEGIKKHELIEQKDIEDAEVVK